MEKRLAKGTRVALHRIALTRAIWAARYAPPKVPKKDTMVTIDLPSDGSL